MSKKGKEPKGPDNAWRTLLESIELNDSKFKFIAAIIEAAGSDQDLIYLSKFEGYCPEEKRSVIKNITQGETIFMVTQRGAEKKVPDPNLRVFEEAYLFLKDSSFVPTDIIALLIKHQIIEMKTQYLIIQREKQELKEGMKQESLIMLDQAEIKGTVAKPPETPVSPPKPVKKGKEAVDEVVTTKEGKKYNTLLRERGEEWRDKTYVDDFPQDGPNLYIAITGFSDPLLISALIKIGVPITAVVQLRIDAIETKVPSTLIPTSKRGQSKQTILSNLASSFWKEIQKLRIEPGAADYYKATAFIVFKPPYWNGDVLKGEDDFIYDDLSFLLYDIQDLERQHVNYLDNMNVLHIELEDAPEVLFNRYLGSFGKVPNESTTEFFVLENILNTIEEYLEDNSQLNPETTPIEHSIAASHISSKNKSQAASIPTTQIPIAPTARNSKDQMRCERAQCLIKDVFDALYESQKKNALSEFDYECHFEDPVVIDYGDFLSTKSFHFQDNINIERCYGMLEGMPINKLWYTISPRSNEEKAKINYHLKVLSNSFTRNEVEYSELARLINILAFRQLYENRSPIITNEILQRKLSEFKKSYLKRSALSEPLYKITSSYQMLVNSSTPSHHSSIHEIETTPTDETSGTSDSKTCDKSSSLTDSLIFDLPEISQLITSEELSSQKPDYVHIIRDYEFFEDFDVKCSLQVLNCVFNEFNCVNYKFCKITDMILLIFFNNFNIDGILKKEWKTNLSTPVCLQDFFDYVLEENYQWIQKAEETHDEYIKKKFYTDQQDDAGSGTNRSCVDKDPMDIDMLIFGSLKYEEHLNTVAATIPSSVTIVTKSKGKSSPSSASSLTKKASSKVMSKINTPVSSIKMEKNKIEPKKAFLGYDINDRRIEIFGRDATFYSEDGTKVCTKFFSSFPSNEEYVSLEVITGNKNLNIFIHKPLGEYTKPLERETVRMVVKNHIQISLNKNIYEKAPNNESEFDFEKNYENKAGNKSGNSTEVLTDYKHYYSLAISCNNGLIVESVNINDSPEISHIRQRYVNDKKPIKGEKMRCITKSGEVIIFKDTEEILIFCPDSSIILVTKYERKPVETESVILESTPNLIPDKNTKKKASISLKNISSKSVSLPTVPEKVENVVYELDIQEFFVAEANGRKKKFSDNIYEEIGVYLIRTATDYNLGEVFTRRVDGTNLLYNKDGMTTVTFPDKTRIISSFYIDECEVFTEWTDEEIELFNIHLPKDLDNEEIENKSDSYVSGIPSIMENHEELPEIIIEEGFVFVHIKYVIEHNNFSTVTVDTEKRNFFIDLPFDVGVQLSEDSNYEINIDESTTLSFTSESELLRMEYIACLELNSTTECDITVCKPKNYNAEFDDDVYWLLLKDSYGKSIAINYEGVLNAITPKGNKISKNENEYSSKNVIGNHSDEINEEEESFPIITPCEKCAKQHFIRKYRFFAMHRDRTISELVHRLLVEDFKTQCGMKLWGSASNYDVFGGNRELLSILYPIYYTESQKWLKESKFCKKPTNLLFKDLNPDEGKGFYKWMRPFERFTPQPSKVPPPVESGTPKAFVLRTLERQWKNDCKIDRLRGGRELIYAILRYIVKMEIDRGTMMEKPIKDIRSLHEVKQYQLVQDLAQRTIEKTEKRLDIIKQEKCEESTTPVKMIRIPKEVEAGEYSYEAEDEPESHSSFVGEQLVEELETVEQMRPQLARYWRLKAQAIRQEEYCQEVLRLGYIPPYFENIYGGEIWWDLNNAVDNAVDISEGVKRPPPICHCAEESSDDEGFGEQLP